MNLEHLLLPEVSALLEEKVFQFLACEDGMDADPPSNPCERALKQYTAMLFNLSSDRLQFNCDLDLVAGSCGSSTLGELVDELAGLINSGDGNNCKLAADCAVAVNEGGGVIGDSATVASGGNISTLRRSRPVAPGPTTSPRTLLRTSSLERVGDAPTKC